MSKVFLCLALWLAVLGAAPAHAAVILSGDDSVTGPDGQVYRISPIDPPAAPASAKPARAVHDHSAVHFNLSSIASRSLQYHQPTNHANHSSAY